MTIPPPPPAAPTPSAPTPSARPRSDLVHRAARAAWWNVVVTPVSAAASLIGGIWILRTMSKGDFGAYGVAIAAAIALGTLSDLGTSRASARLYPDLRRHRGKRGVLRLLAIQFSIKAAMLAVLGILWVTRFGLVSHWIEAISRRTLTPDLAACAGWVFVIAFAGGAGDSLRACFSGLLELRAPSLTHFGYVIARPILVVMLYRQAGLPGALTGLAIASVARICVLVPAVLLYRAGPGDDGDVGHIGKRLARLSVMSYADKMGTFLTGPAFLALVGATQWSAEQLGGVWAALDISVRAITMALAVTNGILVPVFAEVVGERDEDRRRRGYSFALRSHAMLAMAAGAALFAGAVGAFPVIKPEYADAGRWAARIAVFLAVHYALFPTPNAVLMVSERFRVYAATRAVALIAIPVFSVAVPRGPWAGILALGLMRCADTAVSLTVARLAEGLRPPIGALARITAVWITVLVAFGAWIPDDIPGGWFARMIGAGGLTVVGVVAAGVFSRNEIAMVLRYSVPKALRNRIHP